MPEAGQITRPPRRSWSKLALIDMIDLLCLRWRSFLPRASEYEAYFVFYKSKIRAMMVQVVIGLPARMFRSWRVHCGKQRSVVARRGTAHGRYHKDQDF
jgi:hypothetical protein